MKHRAYIFDFDGTLVDSMPYVAKHILNFLRSRGIRPPENMIEILTPLGYAGRQNITESILDLLSRRRNISKPFRSICSWITEIPFPSRRA